MAKYFLLGIFLENTESIMNQNYDNKVLRRIINVFKDNYTNGIEILSKGVFDIFAQIGINKQETYKNIWQSSKLNIALRRDTMSAYLTFLQEFIDDEHYRNFKNNLILSKYYTTFIYKQIESEIASNKFDIPDTLYFNSKFIADLNKINLRSYNFSKASEGTLNSSFQISKLLEISDIDYTNPKSIITSILRQCSIRSFLILMDDETIAKVNNDFHELVDSQKYIDENPYNQISKNIIINCFRKVKKDREKPSILSLK